MKKIMLAGLTAAVLGLVYPVGAADAVSPASCSITNFRGEAEGYVSEYYYFEGTTLLLTNCHMYASTGTNTVQGLSGVTITVDVGTTTTNLSYTGHAISTNLGTWWVSFPVPAGLPTVYVQTKVTDANTNTYIYPWKMMRTKAAL